MTGCVRCVGADAQPSPDNGTRIFSLGNYLARHWGATEAETFATKPR
jgi:hypothetical protein